VKDKFRVGVVRAECYGGEHGCNDGVCRGTDADLWCIVNGRICPYLQLGVTFKDDEKAKEKTRSRLTMKPCEGYVTVINDRPDGFGGCRTTEHDTQCLKNAQYIATYDDGRKKSTMYFCTKCVRESEKKGRISGIHKLTLRERGQ
jgi:hypothetical protein